MYLSIQQCEMLDAICNRFEVALRSYAAITLIDKNQIDNNAIRNVLNQIALSFKITQPLVPINTLKYREKAKSLLSIDLYNLLLNSKISHNAKDIVKGEVLFVGQLIDIFVLFFNPAFLDLAQKFESHEQLIEYLVHYQKIRNNLAHPASAKITKNETEKMFHLVNEIVDEIDDSYFWYSSKKEISKLVSELGISINEKLKIKHNLDMAPKKHEQLLLREYEMDRLLKCFYGVTNIGKRASSVELHGYGGVGKSALSIDLCYEILRRECNGEGQGYSFLLWLSTKTEELSYEITTGRILINDLEPTYSNCNDIIMQLKLLLGIDGKVTKSELFQKLYDNKTQGIIVLDNFETIGNLDKKEISEFIKEIPSGIQFLITSRNYEGISSDSIEVKGFSEIKLGKQFISQFCEINLYDNELTEFQKEELIKYTFGNTLILVICLERIIEGVISIDTILSELQLYQNKEIEIIADFMYKNTFNNTIDEHEKEGLNIDVKKLLRIILLYDEGIDFFSLQELLEYPELKSLEMVLSKLLHRFILVKSQSYYELHDFAKKFVILKLLPDQIQLKKLDTIVSSYKKKMKDDLKKLYEDKNTYPELQLILDDWKAITSTETVAISQAYSEYEKVKVKIHNVSNKTELLNIVVYARGAFKRIELRSNHPYIKFQKGRVISLIFRGQKLLNEGERLELKKEVIEYYEDAYISIRLRHNYLMNNESYAAFLWIYGIQLQMTNSYFEAIKILEEAEIKYTSLKKPRNLIDAGDNSKSLAFSYAMAYLKTKDNNYLEKLKKSVNEARNFYKLAKAPYYSNQYLSILLAFYDVNINSFFASDIWAKIGNYYDCPKFLKPIYNAIREKIGT